MVPDYVVEELLNLDRIFKNITVDVNTDCWNWNKSCSSSGYGQLTEDNKYWNAHVYSFTCNGGKLLEGEVVRHTCNNTKCCNPNHLISGTHTQNYEDSREAHLVGSSKLRKICIIGDVVYSSVTEASNITGMHQGTIIKYTNSDRRFDIEAYRNGCSIARRAPKI